jgi:hypothetical protein
MKNISIILITIISIALFSCHTDEGPSESGAYVISQTFVKQRLKDPSSAKFFNSTYTSLDVGDNTYIVKAEFDAKNEFGGNLRHTYTAKLKHISGDWADINNWTLIDIVIN